MNISEMLSKISARRRELKLTQEEIGKAIGLSASQYSRIESGATKLSAENLNIIAELLKLELSGDKIELPRQQIKEATISVNEYIRLTNEVLKLHEHIDLLNQELATRKAISEQEKYDIFAFLKTEVERLKIGYGEDYKFNWQDIAKAANLPDPENFLRRFAEFQVYGLFGESGLRNKLPDENLSEADARKTANFLKNLAQLENKSVFEILKTALENAAHEVDPSQNPSESHSKKKS